MNTVLERISILLLIGQLFISCSHVGHSQKTQINHSLTDHHIEKESEELELLSKSISPKVDQARGDERATQFLGSELFLKANMSLLDGDYLTSSVLFKHLSELTPNDQFVLKKYAISLIRIGDLEGAQLVLENMYKTFHDEKMGLILAGIYSGLDQEEKAQKLYQKILSVNPVSEDACLGLSRSLSLSKLQARALKVLNQCAQTDKKNGVYHHHIGKIQLDSGRDDKAMESFKIALKRQDDYSPAVLEIGTLLEDKDLHLKAIQVYESFLAKNPNDTKVLSKIVNLLFVKEKYLQVIPYAEKLSDLDPDNLNLKVKLGILYTDAKRYSEAISVFKELHESAPQSDKILYYLGSLYQELKEFSASLKYFGQIPFESALYPEGSIQMANMLSSLALEEYESSQEKTLRKTFIDLVNNRIETLKDLRVEFSLIKAGYFESIGDFRDAMESVLVIQDEKQFTTNHKYYLANLMEKNKLYDQSSQIIMAILEKEPQNAHALNFLGYSILERGGSLEQAYQYISKAYSINPQDGYIRDSLGWYYYKSGSPRLALRELKRAYEKIPQDVEVLKHLAVIHQQLKNYKMAKVFWEYALRNVKQIKEKKEIITQLENLINDRLPASGE